MATYGEMKARIARELHRHNADADIENAVRQAIRHYRSRRFRFNEARATMNTVAGQRYYGVSSGLPSGIQDVDSIIVDQWGRRTALCQCTWAEIEARDTAHSTRGAPDLWCWYGEELRLWPVPDRSYALAFSFVRAIPDPVQDADVSAWTTDAEDLIVANAERRLARDLLRDEAKEAQAARAEEDALRTLLHEAAQYQSTGRLAGGSL